MTLDTTTDIFYNVSGKALTLPITLSTANKYTLAYNSEKYKETSFSTRPIKSNKHALAYEARGIDYREWRMAKYQEGEWSYGHSLPGTKTTFIMNKNGETVLHSHQLIDLGKINNISRAAVVYKTAKNEINFAIAKRLPKSNSEAIYWEIENDYVSEQQASIQIRGIPDDTGKNIAVVLNIKKGQSQRLYLWHDGKFRSNAGIITNNINK